MGTPEGKREPCPDRILDDIGGAFGMGAIGGSFFHYLKGSYNSPQGLRMIGGAQAVRMNAPRVGGSFAVWGGLFSTFDCTMVYLRQKEDPWNSILAGAATGGLLSMRQGVKAATRSSVFAGVLMALIEGSGIMVNKFMAAQQEMPVFVEDQLPEAVEGTSSWFGGLFGGKKKDEEKKGVKSEILESFDAPMPPTFEFKLSTVKPITSRPLKAPAEYSSALNISATTLSSWSLG